MHFYWFKFHILSLFYYHPNYYDPFFILNTKKMYQNISYSNIN
ncbi:hypothetical protein ACINIS251_1436 [Acinetobacter baumannii IS-251]|nr:hypothetical protein ACINBC5_A1720 [Acinetobacter baumannii Canada BC-5]EKK19924.1 hypothetical protein ACINIS251_1436 [Acinetobacter baumannii IS-251]KGP66731.1 putative N-acetyltransferase YedL [Acinetobacter baumannii AB5075]KLT80161.1 hypothetical protein T634_1525 [Acinetobacter baumannii MRSN 7339]KLT84702.1 hypothetical protein T632_1416 [Acinetobacter baumannii MRSN 4106]